MFYDILITLPKCTDVKVEKYIYLFATANFKL